MRECCHHCVIGRLRPGERGDPTAEVVLQCPGFSFGARKRFARKPAKVAKSATLNALCVLCASWVLCCVPRSASAHPVPFSYLDLRIQDDAIEGSLVVHMFDAGHDLNVEPPDRLLDLAVARQRAADVTKLFT